jgi:hypothetical protein
MGLSDHPSNSQNRLEGVAAGLFVRYPWYLHTVFLFCDISLATRIILGDF